MIKKKKAGLLVVEILMLLATLIILMPLLIVLLGSFKNPTEAAAYNLALPSSWKFDNYAFVFTQGGISIAMLNSVILTFFTSVISVFFSALCAFVMQRKRTRYTKFLFSIMMAGMVAPMQVVTTFGLLKLLNLIGTYFAVIMIFSAVEIPWVTYIFYGFFKSIPREMDEAAFIDGAGPFTVFFRIDFPLLRPVIATGAIMVAMFAWNDFLTPLYFFNTPDKWPMSLTIYNFFGQYSSNWNYVFADIVLTMAPITAVYLYFQKYIVEGMTMGAVKG